MAPDSHSSMSFENTSPPQSVPSVEGFISGSSSIYPSAESPSSTEGVAPIRTSLKTTAIDEATKLAPPGPGPTPGQSKAVGPPESTGPTAVQPGLIPGKPGGLSGPPPPDGRFFNNPLTIRTIMTGTGDGYRSPEPPSRLGSLSPVHHAHKDRPIIPGLDQSGMVTERFGQSSGPQPVTTKSTNDPSLRTEPRHGPPPPSSNSSVLPVELMAYNDLMVNIGTAQYLGTEMREPGPPPFAHPPILVNDGGGVSAPGPSTNGYQWQDSSNSGMHESPPMASSFGYPLQGQSYREVGQASTQQTPAGCGGQWPTRGITDYK